MPNSEVADKTSKKEKEEEEEVYRESNQADLSHNEVYLTAKLK
jgi:hypothetical protein